MKAQNTQLHFTCKWAQAKIQEVARLRAEKLKTDAEAKPAAEETPAKKPKGDDDEDHDLGAASALAQKSTARPRFK